MNETMTTSAGHIAAARTEGRTIVPVKAGQDFRQGDILFRAVRAEELPAGEADPARVDLVRGSRVSHILTRQESGDATCIVSGDAVVGLIVTTPGVLIDHDEHHPIRFDEPGLWAVIRQRVMTADGLQTDALD